MNGWHCGTRLLPIHDGTGRTECVVCHRIFERKGRIRKQTNPVPFPIPWARGWEIVKREGGFGIQKSQSPSHGGGE